MENYVRKYAVIVAGGKGERMGSSQPKQFLQLHSKPILWHCLKQFLDSYNDLEIILVIPINYEKDVLRIIADLAAEKRIKIIEGGATRYDSVKNGLSVIKEKGIVFVHDAVRCLVSVDLIHRCYEQTIIKGNAIPAIDLTDSIRMIDGETNKMVDRNKIKIIQTPQTFLTELILPAFEGDYRPEFTDEASVFEASGGEVFLVNGDYNNIKITRPIELKLAELILDSNKIY